jgi:histidinol-phosphate aminotransferase
MSARVALRGSLATLGSYHSAQLSVSVRLNTNESPYPPPRAWQERYREELGRVDFHRYPDRGATELREAVADLHGVAPEEVFCANGSNEVLQCLLLAFGGAGRRALVFEPTYGLHAHIAALVGTEVESAGRGQDLRIDRRDGLAALDRSAPDILFLCSPNNPTGRLEDPDVVAALVEAAPGLAIVDEAYGQFSSFSAIGMRERPGGDGLVVVRTFSKTWALAAARLGYLIAHRDVVAGCSAAALPYHLSAQTQLAGLLALDYRDDMAERVQQVAAARDALAAGLAALPVECWPSDANFLLFRPKEVAAKTVWEGLVVRGVLVRDFSTRQGLEGCLRVTVGTPEEHDAFLAALEEVLQ